MPEPEENKEVLQEKEIKVKGIDTVGDPVKETSETPKVPSTPTTEGEPVVPKRGTKDRSPVPIGHEFIEPKTEKEAFLKGVHEVSDVGADLAGPQAGVSSERLKKIYDAKFDMVQAVPDAMERERLMETMGSAFVPLGDPDKFGIRFDSEVSDLLEYRKKGYPLATKRFLDDLADSQPWYEKMLKTGGKTLARTAVGVGSLAPLTYGLGKGLFTWDSSNIFGHEGWDSWDDAEHWIDKKTVVYGGSGIYDFNEETGEFEQKDFFARFAANPHKVMNADLAPAAAFIGEMVVTEALVGLMAPATGGVGLVANTARLSAKASRFFKSGEAFKKGANIYHGLDKINDIEKASKVANAMTMGRSLAVGTETALRTAGHESVLIAREVEEGLFHELNANYIEKHGKEAPENIQEQFRRQAKDAGSVGFFMNIPLVAGSRFIQFPRLFAKNLQIGSIGAKTFNKIKPNRLHFDRAAGQWKVNADANKYLKAWGWSVAALKGGVTEAFEEFSQEAIESGLIDYYTSLHSPESATSYVDMLSSIIGQASSVLDTVEGRDAVTIGGLMGMLGIRMPIKIDSKTGKPSFSFKAAIPFSGDGAFGGAAQNIREYKQSLTKARTQADELNQGHKPLKEQLKNFSRASIFNQEMDALAEQGDDNGFKNKEHDYFFSLVQSRHKLGVSETLVEELEALKDMELEKFNEDYAFKGYEYTEEQQQEALDKAIARVEVMVKSLNEVESIMQEPSNLTLAAMEAISKKYKIPKAAIVDGLVDQIGYLHSTVQNTKEREEVLTEQIKELSEGTIPLSVLNKVKANIIGAKKFEGKEKEKAGEFIFEDTVKQRKEIVQAVLEDWKLNDLEGYNLNKHKVTPLLDDLLKIKERRAQAASMYEALFTPKGAKQFGNLVGALYNYKHTAINEGILEDLENRINNAKNASLEALAKEEKSVTGNTDMVDARINRDIVRGINEWEAIDKEPLSPEMLNIEARKILDKYPGLLVEIKRRAEADGVSFAGIKTAQEILIAKDSKNLLSQVFKHLNALGKEVKNKDNSRFQNISDKANDNSQPANESEDNESFSENTEDKPANTQDELLSNLPVGENHIFVNTYDKRIVNGKVVFNKETGKPEDHIAKGEHKVDLAKVNAPEFLSTKELSRRVHNAEMRVSEKESGELNPDNMLVEIVHIDPTTKEETPLGVLSAFKEGMPKHFKELRQEILERHNSQLRAERLKTQEVSKLKADKKEVKKKLQALQKEKQEAKTAVKEETQTDTKEVEVKEDEIKAYGLKYALAEILGTPLNIKKENIGKGYLEKGKKYIRIKRNSSQVPIEIDIVTGTGEVFQTQLSSGFSGAGATKMAKVTLSSFYTSEGNLINSGIPEALGLFYDIPNFNLSDKKELSKLLLDSNYLTRAARDAEIGYKRDSKTLKFYDLNFNVREIKLEIEEGLEKDIYNIVKQQYDAELKALEAEETSTQPSTIVKEEVSETETVVDTNETLEKLNEYKKDSKEATIVEKAYKLGEKTFNRVTSFLGDLVYRDNKQVTNVVNSTITGDYVDILNREVFKNIDLEFSEFSKLLESEVADSEKSFEQFNDINDEKTFNQFKKPVVAAREQIINKHTIEGKEPIINTEEILLTLELEGHEGYDGIGGTTDMIVLDANGDIHIYDFKTKKESDKNFPVTVDSLNDHFTEGEQSTTEKWTEQQSIYAKILEKGLGKPVSSVQAVVFPINYVTEDFTGDFNNKKEIEDFKPTPKSLNSTKDAFIKPLTIEKVSKLENLLGAQSSIKEEKNTAQTDAQIKVLQTQLQELNVALGQINEAIDIEEAHNRDSNKELEKEYISYKAVRKKATKEKVKQEIIDKYGETAFQRLESIDNNFQDIIKQIVSARVNVLFKDGKHEDC